MPTASTSGGAPVHAPPHRPEPAASGAAPWLLALVGYLGAQLLARLWVGEALELDEAEQALWTQRLTLGYGTQPPLYTWLQWAVFQVAGVSLLSLALLKNLLLGLTYVFTYAAARTLLPASTAALAAASMLLIPQIGWESQRDLTHSVVCTTMAAATWWAVLALRQRATIPRYLALGVALGLGVLGKYSFVVFAAAMAMALLAAADTRTLMRSRGMLLALGVAAAIVAPHALWLASNLPQATEGTLAKMGATAALPWGVGVLRGLRSGLLSVVAFLTPLWIVLVALFVRRGWRDGVVPGPACGLVRRYLVALAALLVALVLAGAVTAFKDRWMQPFLFFAPVMFFVCAPQLQGHHRLRLLQRLIVLWALLLLVLMPLRVPLAGWRGDLDEMHAPVRALAQALREAGYDGRTVVVNGDRVLAGALRVQLAPATVIVAGRGTTPWSVNGPALWIGAGDGPEALAAIASHTGQAAVAPTTLSLPPRHAPASAAPWHYTFSLQP